MQLIDLLNQSPTFMIENDPADFSIPFRRCGKLEREILLDKYMRMRKESKGLNLRFGFFNG